MTKRTNTVGMALKACALGTALFSVALPAIAEDITLTALDGSMAVSGPLLDVSEEFYLIESKFGPLRVRVSLVECTSGPCPPEQLGPDAIVAWDVSLWGKRRAFTEHVEKIAELVNEKTDGKLTLNLSYGGLSPSKENLEGISEGTFEMAQFCAGYHPEKNPSLTVLELPFLGVDTLEQEIDLSMAVYNHPAVIADMARHNATLLMPTPLPQYNIIGTDFPPTSLAGFTNMKIRAGGGVGRAVEALGAEAITIPATQVQQALADKTVEAVAFAPHAHMAFGTIESGSWWTTNLNPGTANCPVVVNTQALDRLPSPHRIALLSSVDEALEHYVSNYNGATMDAWGPALFERGVVEITINEEIVSTIRKDVAGPAAAAWVEENAARGLPAQELYDLVRGTIAGAS